MSGKKTAHSLEGLLRVCFLNTGLCKMIKNVQIHFQKLKAKEWTYPGMDAEMEMLRGFHKETSCESFFLIGLFHTYKYNQPSYILLLFFPISLSLQLPCLRFPANSRVCFALSPSSQ